MINEKTKKLFALDLWNIGFVEESLDDILFTYKPFTIHYLQHNFKDRWFADPFILDVDDDHIYLLVEDFSYQSGEGQISKLTVEKKTYSLEKVDTVLKLDTHTSFPAILRKDDKVYIYPENCDAELLNLYEYDVKNNTCQFVKTLCHKPLTDAIVSDILGRDLIFSTQLPDPNNNVLYCYDGDNLLKRYTLPDSSARNAGNWFEYKGQWYRPGQDCNNDYGQAISLQRIHIDGDNLSFEQFKRIVSTHTYLNDGCHTFNHYKDITVIDVMKKLKKI